MRGGGAWKGEKRCRQVQKEEEEGQITITSICLNNGRLGGTYLIGRVKRRGVKEVGVRRRVQLRIAKLIKKQIYI